MPPQEQQTTTANNNSRSTTTPPPTNTNTITTTRTTITRIQYNTPFERFTNSLHSQITVKNYIKCLNYFLKYCQLTDYNQLLSSTELVDDNKKSDLISDYLIYLRKERKLSSSYINGTFSAIKRFYIVNKIKLDWDQLALYKGKTKGKVVDDRLYTSDEIKQLLDHADLRMRVVILTLLSTGMRVGGLAGIRLKDMEYLEEYKIYKFKVYNDNDGSCSESDKYITFCTPECASTIKKYLEWREYRGDTLKPQSPLLYRKLTPLTKDSHTKKMTTKVINLFDEPIDSASLQQAMTRLQRKSNVVSIQSETDPYVKSRIRKPMMRCHSFRKMFNGACIENNVNHYVKEMLMGHKKNLGLDVNYFRPQQNQLLQEYLKVIDDLTINDENRLSKQVQVLKEKDDYQNYVIDKKMQEKDEQIKILMFKIDKLSEKEQQFDEVQNEGRIISRDLNTQLIELGKQFEELTARLGIKEEKEK